MQRKDKKSKIRKLQPEEAELWSRVKRTVKPSSSEIDEQLIDQYLPDENHDNPNAKITKQSREIAMPSYYLPLSKPKSSGQSVIDDATTKKLVKGRLPIDAQIDLHGMTQIMAHQNLFAFLQGAYQDSIRMVLVITGKGKSGEGVLRHQVPQWLREPAFSDFVSGFRQSHKSHGGEGALYVRIRKNNGMSTGMRTGKHK